MQLSSVRNGDYDVGHVHRSNRSMVSKGVSEPPMALSTNRCEKIALALSAHNKNQYGDTEAQKAADT